MTQSWGTEADQQYVGRFNMATGCGKTYAMLELWEWLLKEDDPTEEEDAYPITDEDLDTVVSAVKSRSVGPLPPDIAALSDTTRFMRQPETQQRSSEDVHSHKIDLADFTAELTVGKALRETGEVEDLAQLSRYMRKRHSAFAHLSLEEFFWDWDNSATRAAFNATLAQIYESMLEYWGPYRRALELLERTLAYSCEGQPSMKHRDARYEPLPPHPTKSRSSRPHYLLALVVAPAAETPDIHATQPVWLACSDTTVEQAVPPAPAAAVQWSLVVSAPKRTRAADRHFTLRIAAMRLPARFQSGLEDHEAVRRSWETNWRPRVLQLLEEAN
ncbi:hypothetical protein [Streptomyces achromogenes]|uniref:hypothetical protein n=1 Tax=Streptomyces achromogenes TaxID=67255 RepID=UPI003439DCB5